MSIYLQENNLLPILKNGITSDDGSHLLMTLAFDKIIVTMHHTLSCVNGQYIGTHTLGNNYSLKPESTTTNIPMDNIDSYLLSLENEIVKVLDEIMEDNKSSEIKTLSVTAYSFEINKTLFFDLNKKVEQKVDVDVDVDVDVKQFSNVGLLVGLHAPDNRANNLVIIASSK